MALPIKIVIIFNTFLEMLSFIPVRPFYFRYESVYRKKRRGTRDFRKIRKSYQYDETVLY